jgi:hypothetical protein
LFAAAGVQPPAPAGQSATPPQPPVNPSNVDAAGKQIVENYSTVIQRYAEEAYATVFSRAKQDPIVVKNLIESGDKTERSLAEKLLQRNPELFGAGTIEEYMANQALEQAGADPRDREIAQMKLENAKRDQREANREWREWKKEHGVKNDSFGQLCDQVRTQFPKMPESDIVAVARGRAGIKPLEPSALDGVPPSLQGGGGPPPEGGQPNAGAVDALGLRSNDVTAAGAYFEAVGGNVRGR